MKPPEAGKPFISSKPLPMPMPEEMERGMAQAGFDQNFAYHPPAMEQKPKPRMDRPRGGHGPHN